MSTNLRRVNDALGGIIDSNYFRARVMIVFFFLVLNASRLRRSLASGLMIISIKKERTRLYDLPAN